MKKLVAMALALVMVCGLFAACGKTEETTPAADKTPIEVNMESVVTSIIEQCPVEFMGGIMPVDLADTTEDGLWAIKSYTGLDSAENLTDIAVFEPMMGAQAFSLVAVRVAEGADAKAVAQQMSDNIDTRKWICVGADEKIVAGYGDVVVLIMLDSGLNLKAQSFVDAFAQVAGGELDFTI